MNSDVSKELLRKINKSFTLSYQKSEKVRKLLLAIKSKNCDYLKAMEYAEEVGKILAEAYMKNLSSDVLPDGKMYYDIASAILNPTLENNYGLISSYVCGAMDVMNEKAGINAKARKPSYNVDKTLGLIKKVSDAEYFDDVKNYLNEPVITNALSIVDEGARVNAGLHYNMGYKPVIVRRASFGCCPWCRGLAGTYDYEDVKDTGNDVFRRHANCRCQVIYDPSNGNGEVQDVHSKEIIELNTPSKIEEEIKLNLPNNITDVTKIYLSEATPGKGNLTFEEGVLDEDKKTTKWLYKTFGGDIKALKDINMDHVETPDAFWNGKYWEYKNPKTKNAIDKRLKKAVSQLGNEEGGIVLDLTGSELTHQELINTIIQRLPRRLKNSTDIIVKDEDSLLIVLRYIKKR